MVKKVEVYVEGGGDSKDVRIRCREGFHKLLDKSGLERKPHIIACGGRDAAFDKFKSDLRFSKDSYLILLVDSEDILKTPDTKAWAHLETRDSKWAIPDGVVDEQAQLMVTCMETWIMADRDALYSFFGASLNKNSLLPIHDLEIRDRHTVQDALEKATQKCGRDKMYQKGKRSFRLLGELNPVILEQNLPHFKRLLETLRNLLGNASPK